MPGTSLKLDGNAAAGLLGKVFRYEMTTASVTCSGRGRDEPIGALGVYQPGEMGTVMRCPDCDRVLVRIDRHSGRFWLDMPHPRHLQTPLADAT